MRATAYRIPTDRPEADGTYAWDATTLVVAELSAGGETGLGYTYADATNAALIAGPLAEVLEGMDAFDVRACVRAMRVRVRNLGRAGLAATAIAALDAALWDVKAKLLGLPLARLLGQARAAVPIYGSGGFTTYDDATLRTQLAGWVEEDGCRWVKMKIGTYPGRDPARAAAARAAIGPAELFVDANGALSVRQTLAMAERLSDVGVTWFEEPVSSDDRAGLRRLRDRMPAAIDLAAGEYVYDLDDARHLLEDGAVDVLQCDASRAGITGFLDVAALAEAFHVDLSGHCAPALHLHAACAVPELRHLEWFYDHVRIERMLFEGAPVPRAGRIAPDLSRPGLGLGFKRKDAEAYAC
ncbi:enolase C-terminal domain-like protein [uncultured Jannaschia sp.]|uniref:enolase C-terminal domain-like protein n=1 Tax=uncultured Jannaschia sp. TaxID=293347 RepID=UPI0026362539|nr:enolase C-terminal domain-like protein [uncultured Jannaschia sp.]